MFINKKLILRIMLKVKVKVTLEQAMKAQKRSGGITIPLFFFTPTLDGVGG